MSRHRLLVGVASSAIALGGLGVVAGPAGAAQHLTSTVATTVNGSGWLPNLQGPGHGSITGVIGPEGRDAAKLTTQGDGTITTLFGTSYAGTKFADVTGLSYDTYVEHSNQDILAPSIGFEVWGGSSDAFLGSMVYEPYVEDPAQPVQDGVWQHWNATDPSALWWSTRAILNPDGSVKWPAQQAHTLAEFAAAFAAYPAKYGILNTHNGVKVYVGQSPAGTGWDDFVGYVDDVHVTTQGANASDTDWDFTIGIGPCVASEDDVTQTYTLTQDCSTYGTINVPDGWTVDGSGHTLTAVEDAAHPNFPGPVLMSAQGTGSGPATMNVENLDIESSGFENGQNSGGQLAGVKYDRAGGSVSNVVINGISHGKGVQEGIGLWFRNRDASGSYFVPGATVSVDHVRVTNYQKGGVIFDGNLGFTMTDSTVGSAAGPDGTPLSGIAANAVQISRDAHGSITDSTIGLNEYNPVPPPGDGSDATGILVYDSKTVTIARNLITGGNGDVGLDAYNDTEGVLDTHVIASCNLFSRDESAGDYDPYGVGIAQWDDGSTPVEVDLSDTTFQGWDDDTASISFDGGGDPVFGTGATNQSLGQCPPSAPTNVALSGGDQQTDVSWTPASAPQYAPLSGYTVTAKDSGGNVVSTQQVGPSSTTAHVNGLTSGQDYTITVVARSAGGTSTAGTAILHATSLTLSAEDTTVTFGDGTTLNGQLTSTGNGTLAGRQVTIQSAPAGTGTWSTLTTRSVAANGTFSLQVQPSANTDFRAVYAGNPDNSSISTPATVDVAMLVSIRGSAKKIRFTKKVTYTGVVSPNHTGFAVELQAQKGKNGAWTTVDSQVLDAQSSYGFQWKPTSKGKWNVRVMADGDATHVDGFSKVLKLKVR